MLARQMTLTGCLILLLTTSRASAAVSPPLQTLCTKAVPALTAAMKQDKPKIRLFAAGILETLGQAAKGAIPVLAEAVLHNANIEVRVKAAEALGQMGQAAVPALLEAMNQSSGAEASKGKEIRVASAVTEALVKIGPPAVAALLEVMKGVKYELVFKVRALQILSAVGEDVVPALIAALRDSKATVRCQAANVLGESGFPAGIPGLTEALHDSDTGCAKKEARSDIVRVLGKLGNEAAPAVPVLIEALKHDDEAMRTRVGEALANMGDAGQAALIKVLTDKDTDAASRLSAVEALARMGDGALRCCSTNK